ncbi:EH domain-binding protein [Sparganum proliferum]
MSLWKRIQRVGKKAAKFQFTASLEELSVSCCKGYQPKAVVVVLTRRGRRCTSKAITLTKSVTEENAFTVSWSAPENLEIVTTLYRNEKDLVFEEKEWTVQVEDVGMSAEAFQQTSISATTRRRVLAARQLNVSEFAASLPTQNNLKISLRLASKKVTSVVLFLTLHGLMLRTGEATDEDMISLASMMSLSRASSFGAGSHLDFFDRPSSSASTAVFNGPNSPSLNAAAAARYHADLSSLTAKLQGLQHCQGFRTGTVEEEDEEAEEKDARLPLEVVEDKKGAVKEADKTEPHSFIASEAETGRSSGAEPQLPATVPPKKDTAAKSDVPPSKTEQDLLTWCQEVTQGYDNVQINDFSTSFRSGLGFCAILHHFVPELIDFDSLDVKRERENVRLAFDAAAKLGIPRMLDPLEVAPPDRDRPPDRLGIMTYLHQLRMHFSKPSAAVTVSKSVDSPPPGAKTSTPLPTDTPSPSSQPATAANARTNGVSSTPQKSPSSKKPDSQRPISDARASARYDELLAKARTLLEESRTSSDKPPVSTPPPPAESSSPSPAVNQNSGDPSSTGITPVDSPSFDRVDQITPPENVNPSSSLRIRRLKLSNLKLFSDGLEPRRRSSSRKRSAYANGVGDHDRNIQDSFASCLSLGSYPSIMAEKAAIARQQELLDKEAPALEKRLREVMNGGGGGGAEEENLMRRWFSLVNQRNALVHRSYQLSIIEKEKDLQTTSELIKQELHELLSKEDHLKSEEEKQRENTLLNEIVSMVNERNEIIQVLDHQEREFVEDVERGFRTDQLTQQTFHGSEKSCCLQ